MTTIPDHTNPIVRGEKVTVIGLKSVGFGGLGHNDGDILVQYPDGERGCVKASDIEEGTSPSYE